MHNTTKGSNFCITQHHTCCTCGRGSVLIDVRVGVVTVVPRNVVAAKSKRTTSSKANCAPQS